MSATPGARQTFDMTSLGDAGALRRRVADLEAELEEAHAARRISDRRFEAVTSQGFDIITVLDPSGHFLYSSRSARDCFGYDLGALGVPALRLVHPDDAPLARQEFERLLAGEPRTVLWECRVRHAEGSWRYIESVGSNLIHDPAIAGILFHSRDVTEQRQIEAQFRHAMTHDPLTGLPNRSHFIAEVSRAVTKSSRSGQRFAVLAIHLHEFKLINARHGHSAGDVVLVTAAGRIAAALRANDTVARGGDTVARLGGDEFFVLCHDISERSAAGAIAVRIALALRDEAIAIEGAEVAIAPAVGIVIAAPGDEASELLLNAETAMRAVDRGGNGIALFGGETSAAGRVRELRHAIENGELLLHYQPKVEVDSGRVLGVEALVRWMHPARGLISPGEFIPLAEEAGLIGHLGRWVLVEACRQRARWESIRVDRTQLRVCVNVSAHQFDQSLPELVTEVLAETGLAGESLCIELTESVVMTDVVSAITTISRLKDLGVEVSIDDFGTGYSSLAYLRRLPLTELKIDRSFVDGVDTDPESVAIVAAVVAMAHALDLEVIAEGVETVEQLTRLRTLGCGVAQGFLFSRPLPAPDIERYILGERFNDPAAGVGGGHGSAPSEELVVVVDDSETIRQLAAVSLTARGFRVLQAGDGSAGLAAVRQHHPVCAIIDLNLPGMSGIEVCRRLRADPTTANTTILVLTAATEARDKVESFTAGADDYIIKPFSPRDFAGRVRQAIDRRQSLRAN